MTVTFKYLPEAPSCRELNRRRRFPIRRDLGAPSFGGSVRVDAIVAVDAAWKKSTSAEGFAAIQGRLAGRTKWITADRFGAVSSWLVSNALRLLNEDARNCCLEREVASEPRTLSWAEIVSWEFRELPHPDPRFDGLVERLYEIAIDVLPGDYESQNNLVRQTEACASLALECWKSDFVDKLAAAGRKGGQLSKRGPSIFDEQILETAHLDPYRAARRLRCSVSTIQRRRRQLAQQDTTV